MLSVRSITSQAARRVKRVSRVGERTRMRPHLGGAGACDCISRVRSLECVRVVCGFPEPVVGTPLDPLRELRVLIRVGVLELRPLLVESLTAGQELVLLLLRLIRPA